jgi:methyl-accepting chemotaxis protein
MNSIITNSIQNLLRGIGLRTFDRQFQVTYLLIFLLALSTVISINMSLGTDATAINLAGRQRMLSQRVAKEILLVSQGIVEKSVVEKTISLFEESHHKLLNGDAALKMAPIQEEPIRRQMEKVWQLWQGYKGSLSSLIDQPSPKALKEISERSGTVLKEMHAAVGMMAKSANQDVRDQQLFSLIMTGGILFLIVFSRFFGLNLLMNNIKLLRERLMKVSEGDFTHPLAIDQRENETGQIFHAYNTMLEQIGKLVKGVEMLCIQAGEGTGKVSSSLNQINGNIDSQSGSIAQVATATTELAATVEHIARSAAEASSTVDQAEKLAKEGKKIVESNIKQMHTMSSHGNTAVQVMDQLKTDSQEIGKVLSVITTIAEQTNLLALNAAIEAARAGEQGRGFAVVADEVRTLAQRTQESTTEVREIIERLQGGAEKASDVMKQGYAETNTTLKQIQEAGAALEQIFDSVHNVIDLNALIATAAEEQSHVAREIDGNINGISSMAYKNSEETGITAQEMDAIRIKMEDIQSLMSRFMVSA